ncbi:hypothetical protein P5Y53_11210 [Dyella jiangningensis]|uniref:hypothetical protein n=1 Tax=Dyella jiangningensis TaxID=1379159 RepID=UPI00241056BB|nr:hypothetical protein [Dyella jiangningensis]MDG2538233.1 hypothetical protein [Dyella jiangningensis]
MEMFDGRHGIELSRRGDNIAQKFDLRATRPKETLSEVAISLPSLRFRAHSFTQENPLFSATSRTERTAP